MSYCFGDQTTASLERHIERGSLIILPIGTTEEHGPHLPVDTDARIADAYGRGLADALRDEMPLLLMDTVRYGYSMKAMQAWPGTVVVRTRVFMDMVSDICGSVFEMGFTKLVILDCHGHHSGPLNTVSRELHDRWDRAVAIISPAKLSADEFNAIRQSPQGGAIHGGEWETSLMLYLCPEHVDMGAAPTGDAMRYHSEFVAGDNFLGRQRVGWSTWSIQGSQEGVYGDPTVATAQTGEAILEAAVANGARFIHEFYAHAEG